MKELKNKMQTGNSALRRAPLEIVAESDNKDSISSVPSLGRRDDEFIESDSDDRSHGCMPPLVERDCGCDFSSSKKSSDGCETDKTEVVVDQCYDWFT